MTKAAIPFESTFAVLTGNDRPLRWQERLYGQWVANEIKPIIDLPTGLGKTMVMAIWLIARAHNPALPRRLIYVVDRRTVVDQATDIAARIKRTLDQQPSLLDTSITVSTLRGQLADNREWSRDPSKPAIIIGTVDLIGSALLFSGYRSSYKRRPLEAGLLGQDSLLVLDEAHLSKPFEKLICGINDEGPFQKREKETQGKPMRIVRMSATSSHPTDSKPPFTLQFDADGNLTGEDAKDAVTSERFRAKKRLTITTLAEKDDLNKKLVDAAIALAQNPDLVGKRIVVFVRRPEDAMKVADAIRKYGSTKAKQGSYAESVEILTGTMRGLERDELVEKSVFKNRWLHGKLDPSDPTNQQAVFLVSTSAGEVGFDLNADHLVGNAAPLDSWIQRLGRVNRRGKGDATVILIRESKPDDKTDFDKACVVTSNLLTNITDVSPKALAAFKTSLTPEQIDEASSPKPRTVELTDILLDIWSMTSILKPMPGRPEVGPWLRGIEEEQAQTTIAWRAELELFNERVDAHERERRYPIVAKALKAVFAKHPVRPHESLTTYSYRVVEFLKQIVKPKGGQPDLVDTPVAIRLPRGEIVIRTIGELIDDPGILNTEPTLILPSTFGGLNAAGMLDPEAIPEVPNAEDRPPRSLDVADQPDYEQRAEASSRLRLVIRCTEDGNWVPESVSGGVALSERLALEQTYPSSTSLFADLRKPDLKGEKLRIRLVQPIEFDDEGETVRSLVMLTPVSNRNEPQDQSLDDHVGAVGAEAERIVDALGLAVGDPIRIALLFAARWHDEGKKDEDWQRFVYGDVATGQYKGKSSKTRDPKSLRGCRHEFGSLLRIHHLDRCNTIGCVLPADPDARELALHLAATHHGLGRPHFPVAIYRGFSDHERDAIHTDSIRRFARLQRKYGWWHLAWLENLLRCADAMASADAESEDDSVDVEGGEQ